MLTTTDIIINTTPPYEPTQICSKKIIIRHRCSIPIALSSFREERTHLTHGHALVILALRTLYYFFQQVKEHSETIRTYKVFSSYYRSRATIHRSLCVHVTGMVSLDTACFSMTLQRYAIFFYCKTFALFFFKKNAF